jgi:hypothetical protein
MRLDPHAHRLRLHRFLPDARQFGQQRIQLGLVARGDGESGQHMLAVGQRDRVRIDKAGLAHARVNRRARRLQMSDELLLLVDKVSSTTPTKSTRQRSARTRM